MHRIDKFLAKLGKEDRVKILAILTRVRAGNFLNLDLKKLGGYELRYRVRVGKYRIIFEMSSGSTQIIDVDKKSDNTYNF